MKLVEDKCHGADGIFGRHWHAGRVNQKAQFGGSGSNNIKLRTRATLRTANRGDVTTGSAHIVGRDFDCISQPYVLLCAISRPNEIESGISTARRRNGKSTSGGNLLWRAQLCRTRAGE